MAEETQNEEVQAKSSKGGVAIWLLISVVAIGGGFSTPLIVAGLANGSSGTSSTPQGTESAIAVPDPDEKADYIDFEEVVVNLNDPRFSRFLKVSFSMQVAESQKAEIEELVKQKNAVLKNWLIAHIADKKIEDVKGKFGHNRLRREIHDAFNSMLFADGIERIQDVLLKELNVQ